MVTTADRRLTEGPVPEGAILKLAIETIYMSLFIQARGAFRKELNIHLRSRKFMHGAELRQRRVKRAGRSSMLYRSGTGRPRSRIGPRATGTAIRRALQEAATCPH